MREEEQEVRELEEVGRGGGGGGNATESFSMRACSRHKVGRQQWGAKRVYKGAG